MNGLSFLTDPVWSDRCSPVQFAGPQRYRHVPCEINELPQIDFVIISHNHYDHLDLLAAKTIGNKAKWFVPKGLKAWFTNLGITTVTELSWWEDVNEGGLKLTCTPADHYAYEPRWFMSEFHVDPKQAVQIHKDIKSRKSIGMHFGTFILTDEPLLEPISLLAEEAEKAGLAQSHAVIASVFARLIVDGQDHEVHCFLVPLRHSNGRDLLPGVRIGDVGMKYGINGVDNGWLQFEGVRIPATNLLNKFGGVTNGVYSSPISSPSRRFANILAQMMTGRMGLSIAIRYASKRLQFGPTHTSPETPILEYPTHYLVLMPMVATAYAFDSVKCFLAKKFKERNDEAEIHVLVSGAKALLSGYSTISIAEMRRLCGGHGYSSHSGLSKLIAVNDVGRTFEGNINPVATFQVSDAHLLNLKFLLSCMEYRSTKLLIEAANELTKNYKATKNSFQAWNMTHSIKETKDKELRDVLKKLCQLYTLTRIRADFEFYRNTNYLKKGKAIAISKLVSSLSLELSHHALVLVDGFGNEEALNDSPLGQLHGDLYENICSKVGVFAPGNYPSAKL
eukprot:gene17871-21310_t